MKIKVTKSLTLLELLQKFDAGEIPAGEYKSKDGKYIEIYDDASFRFGAKNTIFPRFNLSDIYEVDVEEEITEDTEFERLVEIFDENTIENIIDIHYCERIKYVKDSTTKKIYALINGELQLVWQRDEDE